jgi:flagellar motility protein MotE (MotC chaperone)
MDAMETKDIRISVRKYGDALTREQKDMLLSLTKDDLDKLASIYKKLKPASNTRIDRRR